MTAASILFPFGGPRLSTTLMVVIFMALAAGKRDPRPAYGCLAWLLGFEAVFEATALALGHAGPLGATHALFYIVLGCAAAPWLYRHDAKPFWPLLASGLVFWVVWASTGFHVNGHTMVGFDPVAEALNEASKMLWAAAYLVPLLTRPGSPQPRTRTGADPPAATQPLGREI